MRTIKRGDRGDDVRAWQQFLANQGLDPRGIDGIFGKGTQAATKKFQSRAALLADGIVGKRTIAAATELGFQPVVQALEPGTILTPQDFAAKIAIPAGINAGLTAARQKTMLEAFGPPGQLTRDCSSVTSAKVRNLLVTQVIGQFRVTGIRPAVEAVVRVADKVKSEIPELFPQLGTAGMLCCRAVRGSTRNFSNHAWGTAIDFTINGKLDAVADGRCQVGLALMAPYFRDEKFFWGAAFSREDAMHFEASNELVKEWVAAGAV